MAKNLYKVHVLAIIIITFLAIFDSRTAVDSVDHSILFCLKTVIPGVFPLLLISCIAMSELRKATIPRLDLVLRTQAGTSGYFLIGLLCGYPVGAKLLQDAIDQKTIDKESAKRMMCFCNNASPAFIIGIFSSIFSSPYIAIIMWLIQAISSFLLALVLRSNGAPNRISTKIPKHNIGDIMHTALRSMATICGWITAFGIILAYVNKFINTNVNAVITATTYGIIELTSGVQKLNCVQNESIRFILSSFLLSFGGLCILLQTSSVAPSLQLKKYLFARILHSGISATLSSIAALLLFPTDTQSIRCIPLALCATAISAIIFLFNKKMVAIR